MSWGIGYNATYYFVSFSNIYIFFIYITCVNCVQGDIASRSKRSVGVSTQCPSSDEKQEVLKQMVDSQAVKSLRDHSRLFDKPEIQEVKYTAPSRPNTKS